MPKAEATKATVSPITGGAPKGRGSFPVEPTDGQMSIIRQNSMNRAVEIINQWMNYNILDCDKMTEEVYMKKLHEIALIITDFNSGQDIMNLKKAMQANLKVAQ